MSHLSFFFRLSVSNQPLTFTVMKRAADIEGSSRLRRRTRNATPPPNTVPSTTPAPHRRRSTTPPRSTSSSASSKNNISCSTLLAIESIRMNNYQQIPSIGEDATLFTMQQLRQICNEEPRRFRGVDLVHLDDKVILELLGVLDKQERIGMLPFSVRRRVESIRGYIRSYSKGLRLVEEEKSTTLLVMAIDGEGTTVATESDGGTVMYGCFGLTLHTMQQIAGASTNEYIHNIVSGFKSLVRVAMRTKVNELKTSKPRIELMNVEGFLMSKKIDDLHSIAYILNRNIIRNDIEG